MELARTDSVEISNTFFRVLTETAGRRFNLFPIGLVQFKRFREERVCNIMDDCARAENILVLNMVSLVRIV